MRRGDFGSAIGIIIVVVSAIIIACVAAALASYGMIAASIVVTICDVIGLVLGISILQDKI